MSIAVQNEIVQLLEATDREHIKDLVVWMEKSGFFTSPASTKYHGCYEGGLADHCMGLYKLFNGYNVFLDLNVPQDSVVITSFAHDLCKVGAYLGTNKPYGWNRQQPKGHASSVGDALSAMRKMVFILEGQVPQP